MHYAQLIFPILSTHESHSTIRSQHTFTSTNDLGTRRWTSVLPIEESSQTITRTAMTYRHKVHLTTDDSFSFTCVFSLLPFDNNNSSFYLQSLSVGKCYFSPEAAPFTAEIDGGAWSVTKVGHNILADSHSFSHILFHPLHRSVTKVHL